MKQVTRCTDLEIRAGGDHIHLLGAGVVQVEGQSHPLQRLAPGVVRDTDGHGER